MPAETLSFADYLHAFEVVLDRVQRARPQGRAAELCGKARQALREVEAARLRLGRSGFAACELAHRSGQYLPARVISWLAVCSGRLQAGEFDFLAGQILKLCRGLERLLQSRAAGQRRPAATLARRQQAAVRRPAEVPALRRSGLATAFAGTGHATIRFGKMPGERGAEGLAFFPQVRQYGLASFPLPVAGAGFDVAGQLARRQGAESREKPAEGVCGAFELFEVAALQGGFEFREGSGIGPEEFVADDIHDFRLHRPQVVRVIPGGT